MFCLDGNHSLKRIACVGDRWQSNRQVFELSDYYLTTAFVNCFAGEVRLEALMARGWGGIRSRFLRLAATEVRFSR